MRGRRMHSTRASARRKIRGCRSSRPMRPRGDTPRTVSRGRWLEFYCELLAFRQGEPGASGGRGVEFVDGSDGILAFWRGRAGNGGLCVFTSGRSEER